MRVNITISGFGNVAKELIKLINTKGPQLIEKYNLNLNICCVLTRKGSIYRKDGLMLNEIINKMNNKGELNNYIENNSLHHVNSFPSDMDLLVECTPTDIETGEPGLSYALKAIEQGMNIVFVSKGALVTHFSEIFDKAREKGIEIRYSGATAAALPTLDIYNYSLLGTEINYIEGILNGTTNYILTTMQEKEVSYLEALKEAQEKGIAEKNSDLDIKGIDSACKILLIANNVFGKYSSLKDVNIIGIEHITKEQIRKASEENKVIKLIAGAYRNGDNINIEVKPKLIDKNHYFANVNGRNKAILYSTQEMGDIIAVGGASDPRGTAAALLKDIISIYS